MTVSGARISSARILIVDDNAMGLAARRSVLEELGHQVHACASAQDALEHCRQHSFDLVVTDYRMPKMNGVEFIRQLRQECPKIPIILLSGFTDALGLNEASTGADIVIQKSSQEVPRLIRAVARLLKKQPPKKPASGAAASADGKLKRA